MNCQIYPRIRPPIRLGKKNIVRAAVLERRPLVTNRARTSPSTFTATSANRVNSTVSGRLEKTVVLQQLGVIVKADKHFGVCRYAVPAHERIADPDDKGHDDDRRKDEQQRPRKQDVPTDVLFFCSNGSLISVKVWKKKTKSRSHEGGPAFVWDRIRRALYFAAFAQVASSFSRNCCPVMFLLRKNSCAAGARSLTMMPCGK